MKSPEPRNQQQERKPPRDLKTALMYIEEGLSPGASKDEKNKAIEALAWVNSQVPKPKSTRKPGPKPRISTNVSDEQIRIRLAVIRTIVGVPRGTTSDSRLPALLCEISSVFSHLCETGFFISPEERSAIAAITSKRIEISIRWAEMLRDQSLGFGPVWRSLPSAEQIEGWLVNLKSSCVERPEKLSWEDLMNQAVAKVPDLRLHERGVYTQLRKALGLTIKSSTFEDREASNPETLRAGTCYLYAVRQTLEEHFFCEAHRETGQLYQMIRSISLGNPAGVLPEDFYRLETIFLGVTNRTRVHPFPLMGLEEYDGDPVPILEDGQVPKRP